MLLKAVTLLIILLALVIVFALCVDTPLIKRKFKELWRRIRP